MFLVKLNRIERGRVGDVNIGTFSLFTTLSPPPVSTTISTESSSEAALAALLAPALRFLPSPGAFLAFLAGPSVCRSHCAVSDRGLTGK